MVEISSSAVALIEEHRRNRGIPDSQGGVRIYVADRQDGPIIRMAFVDRPESGDRWLAEHGTPFYLAPETVQPLQGICIDAGETDPPQIVFRQTKE